MKYLEVRHRGDVLSLFLSTLLQDSQSPVGRKKEDEACMIQVESLGKLSIMHVVGGLLLLGFVLFLSVCVVQTHAAARAAKPTSAVAAAKNGPLQTFKRTIIESRRHLAAAAVARSSSIFLMYPVDTIKVS